MVVYVHRDGEKTECTVNDRAPMKKGGPERPLIVEGGLDVEVNRVPHEIVPPEQHE